MLINFVSADKLIQEESPDRLVLFRPNRLKFWGWACLGLALLSLVTTLIVGFNMVGVVIVLFYLVIGLWIVNSYCTIVIDAHNQTIIFFVGFLLFQQQIHRTAFKDIDNIYLDFEERIYPAFKNIFYLEPRIWRKWFVFLTLSSGQTVTIAHYQAIYAQKKDPNLAKQTVLWENLAKKICTVTDKLLIKTAAVPGPAPQTFVDVVDQIIQRQLAQLPAQNKLAQQSIRLRSHPTGRLEIIINGTHYREIEEIPDVDIQTFIQSAVDEWHSPQESSTIKK